MSQTLVFADMTIEKAILMNLARTCVVLTAVGLGIFLAIAVFLARWMVEPVEKAWMQQRQFVADASHELKTPLSIIEGNAELLAEDDLTAQQKEQVDAILRSTERTRNYLLKIRAEVQTPLKFKTQK